MIILKIVCIIMNLMYYLFELGSFYKCKVFDVIKFNILGWRVLVYCLFCCCLICLRYCCYCRCILIIVWVVEIDIVKVINWV